MELCFITCNIRFDNPADGPNAWQYRREFLTQILQKYHPSLIATQEGRIHQLSEFGGSLMGFQIIDEHRSWIGERMYPALFIKNNIFEYLSSGDMWLSETPDIAGSFSYESAFPRLMTWVKLQLKNSDQKILVVNTHLDHIKPETRVQQIQVLVTEIRKVWDKNCPLIIMGDFNDSPDSQVRSILMSEFPFLQDAWKLFNQTEETSHHAFTGEMQNGARIDWILVDQKLTVTSCLMDKSSKDGLYPTDHYPVICTIKI